MISLIKLKNFLLQQRSQRPFNIVLFLDLQFVKEHSLFNGNYIYAILIFFNFNYQINTFV